MKRLSISVLILCLMSILLLCGCDKKQYDKKYVYDGSSLIGKWVDDKIDENAYDVYEFIDNENVILSTNCRGIELNTLKGTYTVQNNNEIVIQSTFGKEYIRFSITKDQKLVLLALDDMNNPAEKERVMSKYNLSYNQGENKLLGTWKSKDNPNEKFVFNEDFTGKSVGISSKDEVVEYKLYYSYKDSQLNIIIEYMIGYDEQVKTANYKIEGDTLTMFGTDKEGKEIKILFEREK